MPKLNTKSGISIYYEIIESSKISNETCVLIGGLTRDHSIWRKLVPQLAKYFRVIIFDNRDSGQSTSPNSQYEIADLADDVADMIESLNFSSVHIIGHSMGGFVGFHLAAKYPGLTKTLTLCSTSEKQTLVGKIYLTERMQLIENNENILAVMAKLYAPETLKNKNFVEEIIKHETNNSHPQSVSSFKRQALACINYDAAHLLKNISCPTLILTGEYDKYYTPENARELASKIIQSDVVIVPNAAHMVQLENPDFIFSALKKFILF